MGLRTFTSGVDGIPGEHFIILKDAANVLNVENSAVATGLQEVSLRSNPKEKAMPKNAHTTAQVHSSHTLVK